MPTTPQTMVSFPVPIDLRLQIETAAHDEGISASLWVKKTIADKLGVPISEVVTRGAGNLLSDEEKAARKRAQAEAAKQARQEARALLEQRRKEAGLTNGNKS